MPSSSGRQHAFMAMSSSASGRAKLKASGKKPAPGPVASEFLEADRGKSFKSTRPKAKATRGYGR